MTNRDNFNKRTINEVALRVGHRCSFPNCNQPTVVKADNDKGYTILGEACHICAASPDGPRYDPNMTFEERTSFDNAIWLCKKHHKIIDDDPTSYTVERLKQFKKNKEDENSKKANGNNLFNQDIIVLNCEFSQLVDNCDFKLLSVMLDSYITSFGNELDELVLRYKCITYIYTGKKEYENTIKDYIDKVDDIHYSNLETIISIAIELCSINSLEKIYKSLKDDNKYKNEVEKLLSKDGLKNYLSLQLKPFNKVDVYKLLINYNLLFERTYPIDNNGNLLPFPNYEETYYEIINQAISLLTNLENDLSTVNENDCASIISQFKDINCLRPNVKTKIISYLLKYLTFCKSNKFDIIYNKLDNNVKENFDICQVKIFNDLYNDKLNFEKLIEFTNKFDDFNLFLTYLQNLSYDKKIEILDEYKYLLKKDSTLFYIYYKDKKLTKEKINDIPNDDLNKKLLYYKNNINKEESLIYICNNLDQTNYFNLDDVITIILENNKNQVLLNFLFSVSNVNDLHSILVLIINKMNSSDKELANNLIELIDNKLLNNKNRDLLIDRGNIYSKLNKHEATKKDFIDAYILLKNKNLLENIVKLKFLTNDFNVDELYEDIFNLNTAESRAYLGNVHHQKHEYNKAKEFYLDSYLMGYQQEDIARVMFEMQIQTEPKVAYIKDNSIVTLHNQDNFLNLVFLKDYKNTLDYIDNDDFKVLHLKDDYSHFKFAKINDLIMFKNKEWKIEKIFDIYEYISSKGLENILKNPNTKTFSVTDQNDPVKEIREFMLNLNQVKEHDLDDLMSNPMKISFNYVSRYFNNNYAHMIEYIKTRYGIYNNINYILESSEVKLLVSSEEVYLIYKFKGFFNFNFENLFLTKEIYNYYIDLCDKNIVELDDDNHMIGSVRKGNFVIIQNSLENKRYMNLFWNDFKSFINNFKILDKIDLELGIYEKVNEIDKLYASILNWKIKDSTYSLLTDDDFIKRTSNMLKFSNFGLLSLFTIYGKEDRIEEFVKEIYKFGFKYYINTDIFLKLQDDDKLCIEILHNNSNFFDNEKHLKLIALNFAIANRNGVKLNANSDLIQKLFKLLSNE